MIVIDEYLAVRLASGAWPAELPDDEAVLPTSRHWRLLQALHGSRRGKLSQLLDGFSLSARDGVRYPHPEVFGILDPRPLLDEAVMIAARYGGTGWLIAETSRQSGVRASALTKSGTTRRIRTMRAADGVTLPFR